MTTVATLGDGVFAADTQCVGDSIRTRVRKLFRLPCGGVAAGAGDFPEIVRFIGWLQAGGHGQAPELKDSTVMVAFGDGRRGEFCGGTFTLVEGPNAIGSGSQAAMCAMVHYGADAEAAVHAAASVDAYTRAPVEVMAVEAKRVRRKAK